MRIPIKVDSAKFIIDVAVKGYGLTLSEVARAARMSEERLRQILSYNPLATEEEADMLAYSTDIPRHQLQGLVTGEIPFEYYEDENGNYIPPEPPVCHAPFACNVHVANSSNVNIINQSPDTTITQTNNFNKTLASMDNAQLSKELEAIRHAVANLPDKNDTERLLEEIQEAARTNALPSKLEKLNKLLDTLSKIAAVAEAAGKWIG